MHVLIGGLGFLGANLAEVLLERGEDVVIVARAGSALRRPTIYKYLKGIGARVLVARNIDREILGSLGGGSYYYLVGKISGSLREQWSSHVGLLRLVIDSCIELGSRLVYVSNVSAVGSIPRAKSRGSVVLEEEEHLKGPRLYSNYHELTKALGERLLVSFGGKLRGKWSITRPGLLAGPWAYHPEWRYLYRMASIGVYPIFDRVIPLVHVRDASEVLAESGSGRYDSKWVFVVAYNVDLGLVGMEMCRLLSGRCRGIRVWPMYSRLAGIAPPSTPLSVAYSLLSRNYVYRSRIVTKKWRSISDISRDYINWAQRYPGLASIRTPFHSSASLLFSTFNSIYKFRAWPAS